MYDLYLKQEEKLKEDFKDAVPVLPPLEILDMLLRDKKSDTVALLDKAIEELEGEREKVAKLDYDSDERGMRKALTTAISHLTNLKDKLLEK